MNRTQIYFTEDEHRFLKKKAYENDVSMAEIIRRIIDEYMQKEEREKYK